VILSNIEQIDVNIKCVFVLLFVAVSSLANYSEFIDKNGWEGTEITAVNVATLSCLA
jgi:hypothetical protein